MSPETTDVPAVHLVRTFAAPPERVYRAWLDPEILRRWMFAGERSVERVEVEERVGGAHRTFQLDLEGTEIGGFESTIVELVPDQRIVLEWGFVGPDREADPSHASRLTVSLAPVADGATELTLVHERLDGLHADMPEVAGMVGTGWGLALENLAAVFPE